MTFPTLLSALRIVLAFVIMILLITPGFWPKVWASACFIIASLTDWLEGYLARKLKQASAFGALIDPIADKVLTLGIFSVSAYQGLMPWWMVIVIAIREIGITAIRMVAANRRVVLAAASEGKHKMVSQVVAISALLLLTLIRSWPNSSGMPAAAIHGAARFASASLWIAVILTIHSGSLFFWRHRAVLIRLAKSS